MIDYKTGVPKGVLSAEADGGLVMTATALRALLGPDFVTVVTSTNDGKHMRGSKHYDDPCNAFDIRVWNMLEAICDRLRSVLGPDFDVINENNHIHIEWDPK